MADEPISDRSRGVALVIGGVLGVFGGHRFYAGKHATGVLMLCTFGGLGLWWLYDMILITAGAFRDGEEKRIVRWWETSPYPQMAGLTPRQLDTILDELETLRSETGELGERVDFLERVLARTKEAGGLPPPAS
jgi:hypothetical protein